MNTTVARARVRSAQALRHAVSRPTHWPELDQARQKVIVALAADYGNLGDLAITQAQVSYLRGRFPDRQVVEWPISQTLSRLKGLRRKIHTHDLIALVGGGNTGDLYDDIEALRQLVIRSFPDNRIVSFPQSVFFSQTAYGRLARVRARRVYASHRDLHLIARDSNSLRQYAALVASASVSLAPDIVLSLDESQPVVDRRGIVLSLRRDAEGTLEPERRQTVLRQANRLDEVTAADTHMGDGLVTIERRGEVLRGFWDIYRRASLVITDRLHGMIFSVITGTPCLALDSRGSKVARFYRDWLEDIDTVLMVPTESLAELTEFASHLHGRSGRHPRANELRKRIDEGTLPSLLVPLQQR